MAVLSFESLTLIALTLIAVVCARNEAEVYYTCDQYGMHVKMTFDHPFRGLFYVEGYKRDPKCRMAYEVPVLEAPFNIPLMACDVNMPLMTAIIAVQYHPLIPTVNDTTEAVACSVGKYGWANWAEVSREAQMALHDYPNVISWLEIGLAPGIFDEETIDYPNNTSFIAFRVYNASGFNDMLVTECIAYDEEILAQNTSIHQITEPIGCPNATTETLTSLFNVTKSERGVITGAFAEFNPLTIPNPKKSFISCSAVLCIDECQCSQNSSAVGHQLFTFRRLLPGVDLDEVTTELATTPNLKSDTTFPERVTATELNTDLNVNIESKSVVEINVSSANLSTTFIPEREIEACTTRLAEISTEGSPAS